MSAAWELAAVHGAPHQDPVGLDPGTDARPGSGVGETFVDPGHHQQADHRLQPHLLVVGGVLDEQGDDVVAVAAGVGQPIQADVGLAQPGRRGEHQVGLARPAPVHRRAGRPARAATRSMVMPSYPASARTANVASRIGASRVWSRLRPTRAGCSS